MSEHSLSAHKSGCICCACESLRDEYRKLLNNLDRAPPEKLGVVVVADPRDTELLRLRNDLRIERAEVAALREQVRHITDERDKYRTEREDWLRRMQAAERKADQLREQLAHLSADKGDAK